MNLTGFVASLIADDGTAGWPSRVPARLDAVLDSMPLPARAGVRSAARALDAYALVRTGRGLAALTTGERESVLASVAARPALLPLLDVLKVPVLLAAGTEHMLQRPRRAPRPVRTDPPLDCTPAGEWPDRSTADAARTTSSSPVASTAAQP
ncbi:oxidoreductase, partial [Streptomyces wuyuanensis]